MNVITTDEVKKWTANASEEELAEFLDAGLRDLIEELEQDDFFGTEGFNKRFA